MQSALVVRAGLGVLACALAAPAAAGTDSSPWLAGGVRAGVSYVDYNTDQFDGGLELQGAGWWVDGELAWRSGDWTSGAFFSFMSHHDNNTGTTPDGPATWNMRLHVYELGVRTTWHRNGFSLGGGLTPLVLGRPYGKETVTLSPLNGTGTYVVSDTEWDYSLAAELHAGYDLSRVNDRVAFQLFALVEAGVSMTSARVGVGVTF